MEFAISGEVISPFFLIAAGFVIGVVGGFFGVGGSFLAGPALYLAGVPMNFVVGTDLAHITGKSVVAAENHRVLGNVDMKLGLVMLAGTLAGVELGARLIELLEARGTVETVVGSAFIVILVGISIFMFWESRSALREGGPARGRDTRAAGLRPLSRGRRRSPSAPPASPSPGSRSPPASWWASGSWLASSAGWWEGERASSASP